VRLWPYKLINHENTKDLKHEINISFFAFQYFRAFVINFLFSVNHPVGTRKKSEENHFLVKRGFSANTRKAPNPGSSYGD
jgi:hypothetical protein